MVRCKFKCESITTFANGVSVKMQPVTSGSEENKTFYRYTPGGNLTLEVLNPGAAKQFEPGKEYYINIEVAKTNEQEVKSNA